MEDRLTLNTTVEDAWSLGHITVRLCNCLRRAGFRTIRDCVNLINTERYHAIRGMGQNTINEFKAFIKPYQEMVNTPDRKTFKECLEILTNYYTQLQEENQKQKRVIEILIKDRMGQKLTYEEYDLLKEVLDND